MPPSGWLSLHFLQPSLQALCCPSCPHILAAVIHRFLFFWKNHGHLTQRVCSPLCFWFQAFFFPSSGLWLWQRRVEPGQRRGGGRTRGSPLVSSPAAAGTEAPDVHSDKEAESEEPQEKAKAQGAPKIEEEEQDLKVMQVCARDRVRHVAGTAAGCSPQCCGAVGCLGPPQAVSAGALAVFGEGGGSLTPQIPGCRNSSPRERAAVQDWASIFVAPYPVSSRSQQQRLERAS